MKPLFVTYCLSDLFTFPNSIHSEVNGIESLPMLRAYPCAFLPSVIHICPCPTHRKEIIWEESILTGVGEIQEWVWQ